MREETERDGETTQLPALADSDEFAGVPSLAEQRTQRRHRRGLARDQQRHAARKAGAA